MECRNHPATAAADRCAGCMEPFCPHCIVTVRGRKYCASCKELALGGKTPVFQSATQFSDEAKEAIKYALAGFICFGIILGLIAVNKASNAKKMMKLDPNVLGFGLATAAQVLGIASFILSGIGLLVRLRGK